MPYAPAIRVTGGTLIFPAGVTAAPVCHSHPHVPEEFAGMPDDMEGQARETLRNLRKGLESVSATFADLVVANRFLTDVSQQDPLDKIWNEVMGESKPTTTTVQVMKLATDRRCLLEINAIAVIDWRGDQGTSYSSVKGSWCIDSQNSAVADLLPAIRND
jgi:2-iminobutanoate/2-iminopropanoate deaminase